MYRVLSILKRSACVSNYRKCNSRNIYYSCPNTYACRVSIKDSKERKRTRELSSDDSNEDR